MLEFYLYAHHRLGWTCIVGILAMIYKTIQKILKSAGRQPEHEVWRQAVLHDRLLQKCTYIIQRGYVTTDDLDELEGSTSLTRHLAVMARIKTALEKVKQLPLK